MRTVPLRTRVFICEAVYDLRDRGDAVSKDFCRNLCHWSHLSAFFFFTGLFLSWTLPETPASTYRLAPNNCLSFAS